MIRDLAFPAVVLIFAASLLLGTQLSHDVSWYLISTGWWLDGTPIYQEILELNPPLAFYLTVPPVWVAELLGVSSTTVYQLYMLILIAISVTLTQVVLRGSTAITEWMRIGFLLIATIALAVLPIGDFGQREHLFTVFLLPYLGLVLVGFNSSLNLRVTIAVWATLGIALKHYFILVPLVLLFHRLISERSFRPFVKVEFALPAALLILYLMASYWLHPSYFERVIPLTLQVYGVHKLELAVLLGNINFLAIIIGAASVLTLLSGRGAHASRALLLVALAAVAIYLIQAKGWRYHQIPIVVCGTLALSWAAFELARVRDHWLPLVPAGVLILTIVTLTLRSGTYQNASYKAVATFFECAPGQRSVQVFSAKVSHGFPLANYAEAEPSSLAPTLWLFPGPSYLRTQTSDEAERAKYENTLNLARDLVVADFFRTNPQLVVVDTHPTKSYFRGAKFEYLDFFEQDPQFHDAWQKYKLVGKVNELEIYRRPGCEV